MILRLYIPVIILMMLKNLSILSQNTDLLVDHFREDYQKVVCARENVYRRNLEDGLQFLMTRYEYLSEETAPGMTAAAPCGEEAQAFAVFREVNPKLPLVYPNWLYKEMIRADETPEAAED